MLDEALDRGAANIVHACLRVQRGERVAVLHWQAAGMAARIARRVHYSGGIAAVAPLTGLESEPEVAVRRRLAEELNAASASVLFGAPPSLPTWLSIAVVEEARRHGCRHLHAVAVEARLLGQSLRADPRDLAEINARLIGALRRAQLVRVSSSAGTDLEVQLATDLPLVSSDGLPESGKTETLPAGIVYCHPSDVNGTFVADRTVIGTDVARDHGIGRRHPATFRVERGRVCDVSCDDARGRELVERYLTLHDDAASVGLVAWPTNHLVRVEVGVEAQDAMLPGLGLYLGYTDPSATGARRRVPVQLRLYGRHHDVVAGGRTLVARGRFTRDLLGDGALFGC